MRFLLILLVALSLTLAWQTSVVAGVTAEQSCIAADDGAKGDGKKAEGDDEPECD